MVTFYMKEKSSRASKRQKNIKARYSKIKNKLALNKLNVLSKLSLSSFMF